MSGTSGTSDTSEPGGARPPGVTARRAVLLLPLAVAAAGGAGAYALLVRMRAGTYDPRGIPSPLIGKPMPDFTLPGLDGGEGFSTADVRAAGHPILINFFASWCVPCAAEAPQLDALHKQGVPFWGIAYKDRPDATRDFLARNGNPYQRLARDETGQTAINFGLFGVPETYFIDRAGIIRWRWAGPITDDTIAHQLDPLRAKYG